MPRMAVIVGFFALIFAAETTNSFAVAGDGPRMFSQAWYEERSSDPPGSRQVYKDGKLWPPYPRPQGPRQTWKHKFHHSTYWPHPYNCEDREYVQNIINQQASLGWVNATTLQDYHFDELSHVLNSAGDAHLSWILTAAPVQHRTVYVAQTFEPEATQARLSSVEQRSRELVPDATAAILPRYSPTVGRPAVEIDTLRRLEIRSIPQPRLFVIGAGGGGGAPAPAGGSSSGQAAGASGGGSSGGSSGSGSR